jgi:hypothetical protein
MINAVIGYDGNTSVRGLEERGNGTNNVHNSYGKGIYERVIQASLMMSCNNTSLSVQCGNFGHAGQCTKEDSKEKSASPREVRDGSNWHVEEDRAHNQALGNEVEEDDSCRVDE